MRDMNKIVEESEKLKGISIWERKLFLWDFIHSVTCIDLGYKGIKFTWDNDHMGNSFLREKLDRAVGSQSWV